jgi:hypothetical protein
VTALFLVGIIIPQVKKDVVLSLAVNLQAMLYFKEDIDRYINSKIIQEETEKE